MVTVRKPAARRPAPTAKTRAAAATSKREVAKPAPAAKKTTATRAAAKNEQLAAARAVRTEKAAAAKAAPTNVHPLKKERITGHDVARAWQTALEVQAAYWAQENGEIEEAKAYVAPVGSAKPGPKEKSPATRAKVEPEDRVIDEYYDRDIVEKYSIKELRELAVALELDEQKLKSKILSEMEEKGYFREDGSSEADEDDIEDDVDEDAEEDEEEDDDEDADSDEDDEDETEDRVYNRDDLKAMNLKELQELAEANEFNWKGLGKAELIDALLADPDEDEEADDEEENEDDEDTPVEIDPDELPNMDLSELLELCEQIDLKVPASKKKNKKAVIQLILDELGDEEDDE